MRDKLHRPSVQPPLQLPDRGKEGLNAQMTAKLQEQWERMAHFLLSTILPSNSLHLCSFSLICWVTFSLIPRNRMDPLSTAQAAYMLARDIYHVSRWVYSTIKSASQSRSELHSLSLDFHHEFSIIFSFCHHFLRDPNGAMAKDRAYVGLLSGTVRILGNIQTLYNKDAQPFALEEDT